MLILAWDTATPSLKLALVEWTDLGSFKTLALYDGDGLASHGQTLAPLVQEVLTQNTLTPKELDLLAVGLGPGSFTGLRVGLALAKGLSFALKIPALGFSTLAVLAAGVESGYVAPLIDAKHKEIFTALYLVAENVAKPLSPVYAVDPERLEPVLRDLAPKGETIKVIGPGVSLIAGAESLNWLDVGQDHGPSAVRLSALAFDAYQKGDEARCPLIPLYGRSPAIFKTYRPTQRLGASKE